MNPTVSELKTRLRGELRARIAMLDAEQRARESAALCQLIGARPEWRAAGVVMLFAALPDEPNVSPLIPAALAAGKSVALPRFVAARDEYEPCEIHDPATDLVPGRFGVLEPRGTCARMESARLVLTLVPGVGFSVDGIRLGRGRGYYDRFLANLRGSKCGVAFECQMGVDIPREPHDVRMNSIATPARWIVVSASAETK